MSQYSEMMGSFIRTGNYPMEANYIFDTEESLKSFFEDPLNKTLLHKGLLKVVENAGDNKQALYWVTKKETNDELEFTKLIEASSITELTDELESLQQKLDKEIQDRKDGDLAIWGTEDPTTIPGELNSIRDLADQVTQLWERCKIHEKMLDFIKALAGTDSDKILEFLATLPYNSVKVISDTLSILLKDWDKTSSIMKLLDDLWNKIEGSPLPTDEFLTLRGVEQFVRTLKQQTTDRDNNLQTELDQTQIGVGLSSDGSYTADKETYYLQDATSIMNALKTLDQLVHQAVVNAVLTPDNSQDVITLTVNKVDQGYIIDGKLDLSSQNGNQLIKKEDGLYYNVSTEYVNGILTVKVNGQIISQHALGFSAIVQSASYDPDQESIIIVFKLLSGDLQTVTIPVGALIREWEVDNSHPDRVVELYHEDVIDGLDKLSGDVRISTKLHNILEKDGNTLYVGGNSDNIYVGDNTLSDAITQLQNKDAELEQSIQNEVTRATNAEQTNANNIASNTSAIAIINGNEAQEGSIKKAAADTLTSAKEYTDQALQNYDTTATERLDALEEGLQNVNDSITVINGDGEGSINKALNDAKSYTDQVTNNISQQLTQEVNRATQAESTLNTNLTTHTNRTDNPHKVTKAQVGLDKVDNTTDLEKPVSTAQQEAINTANQNLKATIDQYTINNYSIATNPVLSKTDIGLANVDNTSDLDKPISTATSKALNTKAPVDSPIFTGVAQVETSPDAADASQRIPSTAWVVERINEKTLPTDNTVADHIQNHNNPHYVTADQVNAYTKTETDSKIEIMKLQVLSEVEELIVNQFENYWGTIE